jgi:hypothetical protein
MTALLTVDTAAMRRLAQRIRETTRSAVGAGDRGSLQPAVADLVAPCLVQAVGTFIERWGAVLADLVDDAHRLADAIELAARTYQDVESVTERRILR